MTDITAAIFTTRVKQEKAIYSPNTSMDVAINSGTYPEGIATVQQVWDPKFVSQINKKLKTSK